jgi:hypothetical protein
VTPPRPADNPFASHRVDSLSHRFIQRNVGDLLDALARHGGRGAVLGPHGSGKTTLLDTLEPHLGAEVVRIRLDAGTARPVDHVLHRLPADLGPDHAILLDGAEQLGWWAWRRVSRATAEAGRLVITSHRPGRLPTILECRTSPALLAELVRELDPATADAVDLDGLFQRHRGNLRLCFRELYDLHSRG